MAEPLLATIPSTSGNHQNRALEDIQLPPVKIYDEDDIFDGVNPNAQRKYLPSTNHDLLRPFLGILKVTGEGYLKAIASELATLNNGHNFETVQQQVKACTAKYRSLFKGLVQLCNIPVDLKKEIFRWFSRKLGLIEGEAPLGMPTRFWQILAVVADCAVTVVDWTLKNPLFRLVFQGRTILTNWVASAATGVLSALAIFAIGMGLNWLYQTDLVQDYLIKMKWKPAIEGEQDFEARNDGEVAVQQEVDHDLTSCDSNSRSVLDLNVSTKVYGVPINMKVRKESINNTKRANNIKYMLN